MLGTSSSTSPLLTFEASAFCCFSSTDLPSSTLNVALLTRNSSLVTREGLCKLICSRRKWSLQAVDQPQVVLVEDQEKAWEQCKHLLSAFNFTTDEADKMLKKAFGWVHSPYWGEERKKEVPQKDSINATLDYLKSLSLSDDDLNKLLKKFPEVLGCDLNEEVKSNVSMLESLWGIKGKPLRNLLLRNPKVLGYNVDCKGDCMAQCTRCWVRF